MARSSRRSHSSAPRARPRPARRRPTRIPPKETLGRPTLPFNVRVSDVMTAPVVTIGPEATLFEALMLLRSRGTSGLPVMSESGTVAGVLSERDLARVMMGAAGFPEVRGVLDLLLTGFEHQPLETLKDLREKLEATRVGEVMSAPAFTISPDAQVEFAAKVMREHEINRLPVVEHGRLVGIVTRHDLIKAIGRAPAD
ncbi:MAG TPA: CBS domain-containing protein [Thermoplasmata archaeon]|nr:CBS domain-containing protein [Thermoplasmata archaeon]